jgi:uncharacterized protein
MLMTSNENDLNLVYSKYCQVINRDGVKVEVSIVRLEHENEWTLEVCNEAGTSIVWDDVFVSDNAAFEELQRTIKDEGMRSFLDGGNVVQFPQR